MQKFLVVAVIFSLITFNRIAECARPLVTDDAGTVENGEYEVEFGYDHCNEASTGLNCSCCLGFKHGLTDRMDIGLGLSHYLLPQQLGGLSPASLSLKFAIVKDLLAVSFSHELGGSAYVLNCAVSRTFGPAETNLNLGYSAIGQNNVIGSVTYGLSFIYEFGKWDLCCESLGNRDGFQDWLAGVRFKVFEGFGIDLAYNGNFKGERQKGTAGLHYEF